MITDVLIRRVLALPLLLGSLVAVGSLVSANAATVGPCAATSLTAKATGSGTGMSQPYTVFTVTNASSKPCTLKGYPVLTGAWTAKGKVAISISNGAVMNMPSVKVKAFVVAPKGNAWFAIGSGTAYDSPLVTIRRFTFATTAGASVAQSSLVEADLQATAPTGKPYPLGVTAFAPGKGCDTGSC